MPNSRERGGLILKSKFTPEQTLRASRQAVAGTPMVEICRKLAVTETTLFRSKQQYTGLDVSELRDGRKLQTSARFRVGDYQPRSRRSETDAPPWS